MQSREQTVEPGSCFPGFTGVSPLIGRCSGVSRQHVCVPICRSFARIMKYPDQGFRAMAQWFLSQREARHR